MINKINPVPKLIESNDEIEHKICRYLQIQKLAKLYLQKTESRYGCEEALRIDVSWSS